MSDPTTNDGTVTAIAQPAPALSATQLGELLKLLQNVDSVELKLTVPDSERRSAVAALDMDPLEAQIRQVAFFDTLGLDLLDRGVIVRARRIQGKPADSVVKLRPVNPAMLPEALRANPDFSVEVDVMPGGFVCSGSMRASLKSDKAREVLAGSRPVRALLSKQQRTFLADNAPAGVRPDGLRVLGPVNVLKLKFTPADLGRRMVAELWLYPDGSRLLELSTKCAPAEAFTVAAQTRAFLGGHGIDLSGQQQTKTRSALEFFAGELAAAQAESGAVAEAGR